MDIILLTIGHPYPQKDVFVANEIPVLSQNFNNVWIVPVLEGRIFPQTKCNSELPCLPRNVHVCNLKYSILDIILFDSSILKQIFEEWQFNLKKINTILRWGIHANIISKYIIRFINEHNIKPENTVLYSFWFHFNALAIACMHDDFALKISRAHGYDLYEERGQQPFKIYILERLDGVFTCSKLGSDYLIEKYRSLNVNVSYLGSMNSRTIDRSGFNKGKYLKVVSCSRIIPIKRLSRIIDALALIKDIRIDWIHIGDGNQLDNIKAYANTKLSINKNISYSFVGALTNEDVLNYYNNNNINLFINVSSSEGLPVSIMEAISFGIPVIATDVGGVSEIVDNAINGFLLEADYNDNELVDLIIRFNNMPHDEYKRMCEAAIMKWENRFNGNKNYTCFIQNLYKLINRKKEQEVNNA